MKCNNVFFFNNERENLHVSANDGLLPMIAITGRNMLIVYFIIKPLFHSMEFIFSFLAFPPNPSIYDVY
jgi:hypothetical protein